MGQESIVVNKHLYKHDRQANFTPTINAGVAGFGGIGIGFEKTVRTSNKWKFSGHLSATEGKIWHNKLQWVLEENQLEQQPTHSSVIHTGFAFEHNATSFCMSVEVSGKLARTSNRIKNKLGGATTRLMKFGGSRTEKDVVTTRIEWTDGYSSKKLLDPIARGLARSVEYENWSSVPLELPHAMPADFLPVIQPTAFPAGQRIASRPTPQQENQRAQIGASQPEDTIAEMLEMGRSLQELPNPTVETIDMAAGFFSVPDTPTAAPVSALTIPHTPATYPAVSTMLARRDELSAASELSYAATLVDTPAETSKEKVPASSPKLKVIETTSKHKGRSQVQPRSSAAALGRKSKPHHIGAHNRVAWLSAEHVAWAGGPDIYNKRPGRGK